MPSAAPLAALERRLDVVGGGVSRLWGGLVDEDADSGLLASLSEADRASDEDEMEPLRDDWRRCEELSGWAVVMFMLQQ
jgi:hypothetical protein